MILPIFYSVLACLFWGLIFVAPLYLVNFDSLDIVLGRFLAFGTSSVFLLSYYVIKHKDWKLLTYWKNAGLCAIVMNLAYFTALTLGMRLSNPSLITLIVGLAPILIITITSRTKNGTSSSILLGPTICIFIGIVLLNIESFQADWQTYTVWQYIQGILYGLFALAAWTWYVIYNTQLLQKNPDINPIGWTALIGVVTLAFTLFATLLRMWTIEPAYLQQFSLQEEGLSFISVSLVLGLVCSLCAFSLWNIASSQLSSALSGQLAILETVFGLMLIYMFQQHVPTPLEISGIICILSGIWKGLYNFNKEKPRSLSNTALSR